MKKQYIGIGALLAVGFFYGLSGMLAKYVTGFFSPLQAGEIRFVVAFLLAALVSLLLRKKIHLKCLPKKLLLLYALAFPLCVLLFTLAIFHSTVALATAAAYGSALLASFILGRIFFGEKVDFLRGAAFFLTLLALLIFTEPWREFSVSLGLLFGVLSGLLQGASNAAQKSLNRSGADHSSLLLLQCAAGALLATLVVFLSGEPIVFAPEGSPWLLLLYGAASVATVYLFLVGFKYIDINRGSILVSSQIIFGPALAWLFLQEAISLHVALGGAIVLAAGVCANWPRGPKKFSLAKEN